MEKIECADKYKSDIVFIKPILAFPTDKEITIEALQTIINSKGFVLGGDFNPESAEKKQAFCFILL